MENRIITINNINSGGDLKLSDIVTRNKKSYYIDTTFVYDALVFETMVFEMKRVVVGNYDVDNIDDVRKLMDLVKWNGIYTKRHAIEKEAEESHNMVVNNIFKYGRAEGAVS